MSKVTFQIKRPAEAQSDHRPVRAERPVNWFDRLSWVGLYLLLGTALLTPLIGHRLS